MKTTTRIYAMLLVAVASLTACGKPQPKTYSIGIVNFSPSLDAAIEGFKMGMAQLGYVEGENVTYIYEGVATSTEALDPAVQNLLAADVDLILSLTTLATLATRQAVEATDVPIVFAGVNDPVASGLVKSLREPGGNPTGVQAGGSIARELEWLLAIAPDTTSLFVPHNPGDAASVQAIVALSEAAATLGIELLIVEVRTPDELAAALDAIPESADAMFVLSSGFLSARLTQLVETRMQDAAERGQTLINDLLRYSRVTTRGEPFAPVDLNRVALQVGHGLEAWIEETGGQVALNELPTIVADATQMRQLLQNLIGNALKYRHPGTPPRVEVTAEDRSDHEVRIFVKDNGIGFDTKYLDRIFLPCQRLHGRAEYEGTGVGLAICRKIADPHGGSISAESTPGQGATFIVTLPTRQINGGQP